MGISMCPWYGYMLKIFTKENPLWKWNIRKIKRIQKLFRNGFIRQLVKFYERCIFDVAVPVMVGNEEKTIKGGRMNEEQLDKYLSKMNEHFETSFYEMYETIDNETNEVILEYQPKDDEKIIRFVALTNTNNFPISKENIKDRYGIVSCKTNTILEN